MRTLAHLFDTTAACARSSTLLLRLCVLSLLIGSSLAGCSPDPAASLEDSSEEVDPGVTDPGGTDPNEPDPGGTVLPPRDRTVSASMSHSCVIHPSNSSLVCWGTVIHYYESPHAPSSRRFRSIVSGSLHTCAIHSSGRLLCFGNNYNGQVYNPGYVPPSDTRFDAVAVGGYHTCAIPSEHDGVFCWGRDDFYQVMHRPSSGSFREIAAGWGHTCAIRSENGEAHCWGRHNHGQTDAPAGVSFSDIAATSEST